MTTLPILPTCNNCNHMDMCYKVWDIDKEGVKEIREDADFDIPRECGDFQMSVR